MSKRAFRAIVVGAVIGLLGVASYAVAGGGGSRVKSGTLTGYEENPDISTIAKGSFEARIRDGEKKIAYKLTYIGLEGAVQQAHIHFGKPAINGGVSVFLCSNLGNGPQGTPACPPQGTVEGELDAADVVGPNTAPTVQGIEPGAFSELVDAIQRGTPTSTCTRRSGRAGRFARRSAARTATIAATAATMATRARTRATATAETADRSFGRAWRHSRPALDLDGAAVTVLDYPRLRARQSPLRASEKRDSGPTPPGRQARGTCG